MNLDCFNSPMSIEQYIDSTEREYILAGLDRCRWNYSEVARQAKTTLRSMRYKLAKLGLVMPIAQRYTTPSDARKWGDLRMAVLKRDKGRCQCCGATAKDDVTLHVDHIKSRLNYPELQWDIDNLQVLCADCNIRKGSKDETDWRSAA